MAAELEFVAVFRTMPGGVASQRIREVTGAEDTFSNYHIPLTPFAVAVSSQGKIADTSAVGSVEAVREFVHRAKRREFDVSAAR
jgi:hypothetical protein